MDVNQIIDQGGYLVPNPRYDKKDKKSKEPPMIISKDIDRYGNPTAKAITNDPNYHWEMPYNQSLHDFGITPYRGINVEKALNQAQSKWSKAFGALTQTASEVILGTAKATADLGGFLAAKVGLMDEDNYHNPVSDAIKNAMDYVNEDLAPIHVDPDSHWGDFGWYMSNIPSIVSSLTLMLPARGTTKLVKGLGKLSRNALSEGFELAGLKKAAKFSKAPLSSTRKWLAGTQTLKTPEELNGLQRFINDKTVLDKISTGAEIGGEALLMRTMENYQESGDVYEQQYKKALNDLESMRSDEYGKWISDNADLFKYDNIDLQNKDAVAKAIAKKSADRTFQMDFANTMFDVVQLYGLRNIGRVKEVTGGAVAKAERQAIAGARDAARGQKALKESLQNALETEVKPTTLEKVANWGKHLAKDYGKVFLTESTEGIEEAVNFIAQQEGINYGNSILKGEKPAEDGFFAGAVKHTFDMPKLLYDYRTAPELWESAFWGLMGGVIFGIGGDKINARRLRKQNEKTLKRERERTLERLKAAKLPQEQIDKLMAEYDNDVKTRNMFVGLEDVGDIKAAKTAIAKRNERLAKYSSDIDNIDNGLDIYGEPTLEGYATFTGDVELKQAAAKSRAKNEFITGVALDALGSGTYKSLVDYFSADEVKQAMIEGGLVEAENADNFINETLSTMESVKQTYKNQTSLLLNNAAVLNASRDFDREVPFEFIRMMAATNTRAIMDAKMYENQLNILGTYESREKAGLLEAATNPTDLERELSQTKELIEIETLSNIYSQLEAQRRYVENNYEEGFAKQRKLKEIEERKKIIYGELKNNHADSMYYALSKATAYEFLPPNSQYNATSEARFAIDKESKYYKNLDDELIQEFEKQLRINENEALTDDEKQAFITRSRAIKQNLKNLNDATNVNSIKQKSPSLYRIYQDQAAYKFFKPLQLQQVITSVSQIADIAEEYNNRLNSATLAAIDTAEKTFTSLFTKYESANSDDIEFAFYQALNQNEDEARARLESFMDKNDVQTFFDTLDIFRFRDANNIAIANYFLKEINDAKERLAHKNANEQRNTKSQSTDQQDTQNASDDTADTIEDKLDEINADATNQNDSTDSTDSQDSNQDSNQDSSQDNGNVDSQADSQNRRVERIMVHFDQYDRIAMMATTDSGNFDLITTVDNFNVVHRELDFMNQPKDMQRRFAIDRPYMFTTVDNGLSILDPDVDFEITKNPEFDVDLKGHYSFKSPGVVRYFKTDGTSDSSDSTDSSIDNTSTTDTGTTSDPFATTEPSSDAQDADDVIPDLDTATSASNSPMPSPFGDSSGDDTATSSSTGEQGNQDELEGVVDDAIDEWANNEILKIASDPFDESVDLDEVLDALKTKHQATLNLHPEAGKVLEDKINDIKQTREEIAALNNDVGIEGDNIDLLSSAMDTALKARFTNPHTNFIPDFFSLSIQEFLTQYAKYVAMPIIKVDGVEKQAIRLSDVVRLLNSATGTNALGETYFNLLKAYLFDSVEGKTNYVVIDIKDVNSNSIQYNLDSTDEELREQGQYSKDRIRAITDEMPFFMANLSQKDQLDYRQTLENLRTDDELEVIHLHTHPLYKQLVSTSDNRLGLAKNGVIVALYPTVQVLTDPGTSIKHYITYNRGWHCEIFRNSDGNVDSPLKTFLYRVLFDSDKKYADLRDLLVRTTYFRDSGKLKNNAGLQKQISQAFWANDAVIEEIDGGLLRANAYERMQKTTELDKELDYLLNVFNYCKDINISTNSTDTNTAIAASLDSWFEKIYDECAAGERMQNATTPMTVRVSSVSEGKLLPVVNSTSPNTYDSLGYPSQVLDGKHKVAMSYGDKERRLHVGNTAGILHLGNVTPATYITIFDDNGNPTYTNAYGARIKEEWDKTKNPIIKTLFSNISSSLSYILTAPDVDIFAIKKLLSDVILMSDEYGAEKIRLFRTKAAKTTFKTTIFPSSGAISLTYKDSNGDFHTFSIYTRSKKGGRILAFSTKVDSKVPERVVPIKRFYDDSNPNFGNDIAQHLINFVYDKLQINMDMFGIDNASTSEDVLDGAVQRKNGKYEISFPYVGTVYNFDDYSEFLLNNDLVKINLKKSKTGSNYSKVDDNGLFYGSLYVNLRTETKTDSTNKNMTDDEKIAKEKGYFHVDDMSEVNTMSNIQTIIESDSTTKGEDAIREALKNDEEGKKQLDILDEIDKDLGLDNFFPTNMLFDPTINYYRTDNKRWSPTWAYSVGEDKKDRYYTYKRKPNGYLTRSRKTMPRGTALVGLKWLNAIASRNKFERAEAISKLVHENLHIKLGENPAQRETILKGIKQIHDEYADWLNNVKQTGEYDNFSELLKKEIAYVESVWNIYKNSDKQLEEFFVESITSRSFFDVFNKIDATIDKKSNKKTIWSRILEWLSKLLGYGDIRENSLLDKNLQLLREVTDSPTYTSSPVEDSVTNTQEDDIEEILPEEVASNSVASEDSSGTVVPSTDDSKIADSLNDSLNDLNSISDNSLSDDALSSAEADIFNDAFGDLLNTDGSADMAGITESGIFKIYKDGEPIETVESSASHLNKDVRENYKMLIEQGEYKITCK